MIAISRSEINAALLCSNTVQGVQKTTECHSAGDLVFNAVYASFCFVGYDIFDGFTDATAFLGCSSEGSVDVFD